MRPRVFTYSGRAALADAAASEILRVADESVHGRGVVRIALAGGTTPTETYERLAAMGVPSAADAARWHVFFGDERIVPSEHPDSNYGMASKAWLSRSAIPSAHVHRVSTEVGDAASAAAAYETTMRLAFGLGEGGVPVFDLVLLGIGADGHTASLFPGSSALAERTRLVVAVRAQRPPIHRVTLTLPVLNAARNVRFIVSGAEKASVLRALATEDASTITMPAALVRPPTGSVEWLVDDAAASALGGASR